MPGQLGVQARLMNHIDYKAREHGIEIEMTDRGTYSKCNIAGGRSIF